MSVSKGSLLLAEPFMYDGGFKRSVILICDHSAQDGAVGYVLNKVMNVNVQDVINDFPEYDAEMYYGGPVGSDTLHYLHTKGEMLEGSVQVCPGVWWGGDFEKMKFLLRSRIFSPKNIKFFLGYSGWSPGQLEDELAYGSWVTEQMDSNYLFPKSNETLWSQVMRNKGKQFTVISTMPDGQYQN